MAFEMTALRSRRALLAGALGAVGSAAAATIAGAQRVFGAGSDGETVVVGGDYPDVRSTTTFRSAYDDTAKPGMTFRTDVPGEQDSGRRTTVSADGVHFSWTYGPDGYAWHTTVGPGIEVYGGRYSSVGIMAQTTHGPAILGQAVEIGVRGKGDIGVRGQGGFKADRGRGGVFSGGEAQVRLAPSKARNHPASGQTGDLFVDAQKRLWFCRGYQSWVRLA